MGQPSIVYPEYATTAAVTMSLAGNGETTDVLIATEDTYYAPQATTAFNIVIDLASAQAIDTLAILGSALDGVGVEVRASTDNFSGSDVSILTSTNLSSEVNAAWLDFTPSNYRYWKLMFTGHPSNIRLANLALISRATFPYFETDPDVNNIEPTAVQLVSQSGVYIGANQQRAMRKMPLEWGTVTPSEFAVINTFAIACIETVNPFYLISDVDEVVIHFGWLDNGGQFNAPRTSGIYEVQSLSFVTRAV